jgi:hypothetical protein
MAFTKSNMPVPALKRIAPKGTSKYNFADMVVGDALVDSEVVDAKKAAARLTSAVASYRKRSGDKRSFTVRTFKQDNGADAVGVWLIAPKAVAETAAA